MKRKKNEKKENNTNKGLANYSIHIFWFVNFSIEWKQEKTQTNMQLSQFVKQKGKLKRNGRIE